MRLKRFAFWLAVFGSVLAVALWLTGKSVDYIFNHTELEVYLIGTKIFMGISIAMLVMLAWLFSEGSAGRKEK